MIAIQLLLNSNLFLKACSSYCVLSILQTFSLLHGGGEVELGEVLRQLTRHTADTSEAALSSDVKRNKSDSSSSSIASKRVNMQKLTKKNEVCSLLLPLWCRAFGLPTPRRSVQSSWKTLPSAGLPAGDEPRTFLCPLIHTRRRVSRAGKARDHNFCSPCSPGLSTRPKQLKNAVE